MKKYTPKIEQLEKKSLSELHMINSNLSRWRPAYKIDECLMHVKKMVEYFSKIKEELKNNSSYEDTM